MGRTFWTGFGAVGLIAAVACAPLPEARRAEADYVQYCAGCHGMDGTGLAGSKAANLTALSVKNGGIFPRLQVMGKVYGYTMGRSASEMPEFGEMLEGESIIFDAGDGKAVPTPRRLVDLTRYLEHLQR